MLDEPLASRMRPVHIEDIIGQDELFDHGSILRGFIQAESEEGISFAPSSVILWGPPGSGKTTIAYVVARNSNRKFVQISAVDSGVKDLRLLIDRAKTEFNLYKTSTIVFIDEIHRFSKSQQDILLPSVENGWVTLLAATTENPSFSIISPLLSRSLLINVKPLSKKNLTVILNKAIIDERGLQNKVKLKSEKELDLLIDFSAGDARKLLIVLEAVANIAMNKDKNVPAVITDNMLSELVENKVLDYDKSGDNHYDFASAFIKSMRGSDPDAALFYLGYMLSAGEDVLFIARRMVIFAAEDIGLADPNALNLAVSAANAVNLVGMPESRIILSELVIYLALSPKSNSSYLAINKVQKFLSSINKINLPDHLKDSGYFLRENLGYGMNYKYPHDYEHAIVSQEYLPKEYENIRFYNPKNIANEKILASRYHKIKKILKDQ